MSRSKLRTWWATAGNDVDPLTLDRIWIGTISRSARGYLAISQAELAAASGIGRTTILFIEKGTTVPDNETASRLRDYFESAGVEVDVEEDALNIRYAGLAALASRNSADVVTRSFTRWKNARATRSRAVRGSF